MGDIAINNIQKKIIKPLKVILFKKASSLYVFKKFSVLAIKKTIKMVSFPLVLINNLVDNGGIVIEELCDKSIWLSDECL